MNFSLIPGHLLLALLVISVGIGCQLKEIFPEEFRTQGAFVESEMVDWLAYRTELGRAPDEIELMKVITVDSGTSDGRLDYFAFRFRTHEPYWAAEDGWSLWTFPA
jgi:hypothetical protein